MCRALRLRQANAEKEGSIIATACNCEWLCHLFLCWDRLSVCRSLTTSKKVLVVTTINTVVENTRGTCLGSLINPFHDHQECSVQSWPQNTPFLEGNFTVIAATHGAAGNTGHDTGSTHQSKAIEIFPGGVGNRLKSVLSQIIIACH